MAKITWLGEDSLHESGAGPSSTTWKGIKFPIREAVEVSDADMIRRAKGNQFFKVEEPDAKVQSKTIEPAAEEPSDEPVEEPARKKPGRKPKVKTDGDEDQG